MCAKPFRALTPTPLVCCGVETAFSKDQKSIVWGMGLGRVLAHRERGQVRQKKKQASRTASLIRPYDIAIQVNADQANFRVTRIFRPVSKRSSTHIRCKPEFFVDPAMGLEPATH